MDEGPELESITEELYAHPPAEFVTRRDELAKRTRAAGDALLAKQIKALRRPSVGAWYLNASARAGLVSLSELTHLGEQLRDAQSTGDFAALRELATRRNPVVAAAVRELVAELARLGTTATPAGLDEVRSTLASALADPEVADQLTRGRLDRPHNYSGFGELSVPAAVTMLSSAQPVASPEPGDAAARRARELAEQALAAAEADLETSTANRAAAEDRARVAGSRVADLSAELAAARDQLAAVEAELAGAADQELLATDRVEQARIQLQSAPDAGRP